MMILCPHCGRMIYHESRRCVFCKEDPRIVITPAEPNPVKVARAHWAYLIVLGMVVVAILIVFARLSIGSVRQCAIVMAYPQTLSGHAFTAFDCLDSGDQTRTLCTTEKLKQGDLITYEDYDEGDHAGSIREIYSSPDHIEDHEGGRPKSGALQPEDYPTQGQSGTAPIDQAFWSR
jgi:hypothetical protein